MHLHFVYLLALLLLGATVHAAVLPEKTIRRTAEIGLLYLLVGYCGVPMLAVSLWVLVSPEHAAAGFGLTAEGPLLAFFGWAYLGMSLLSLLALRYRGAFLVAPVVVWAVYLAGATAVHVQESPGRSLEIFASHGLIAGLLVAALLASGAWRARA
ncbi:MAG TPA: DUF6790 family protein [Gemmatimonadales bacterium]|nr:DUF6790 family protein [Gemmatimonadales bacterium]